MFVRFLEYIVLRGLLWVGLPMLLVVLAVGPSRTWSAVKRAWNWIWRRRLDPEEVLTRVVRQYEELVKALRQTVERAEGAEREILRQIDLSEKNLVALDQEAEAASRKGDELEARAVQYKQDLERQALATFKDQLDRQRRQSLDIRRNLYLIELQLRQYEVGRSVLLSQLAEARSAEQQFAIASQFDPFSAVANWKRAEGMVQEKSLDVEAIKRVHADLTGLSLPDGTAPVDSEALQVHMDELKERVRRLDKQ